MSAVLILIVNDFLFMTGGNLAVLSPAEMDRIQPHLTEFDL
jgi:hypothetical protein